MPTEVTNSDALFRAAKNAKLIGVDGDMQVGKTPIAQQLSGYTNGRIVSLDKFIVDEKENPSGRYALRLGDLQEAITTFCKENQKVIIEGITLQKVLDNIEINLSLLIYVKSIDHHGFWRAQEDYSFDSANIAIDSINQQIRAVSHGKEVAVSPLREEVIHYHYDYKPWETSDIVYNNQYQD